MFSVVVLEAMLNFSVPLYIQVIQGRTRIETAVVMLPFNLTVFFTAMLVVRLYKTLTPRRIGQLGFAVCTVALLWLAFVVRNDWSAVAVMSGLIVFGIGQGALVTLVFNVLVTAAPKELAGDVGSLRGTVQNLAAGVGTVVADAVLVALLSSMILYRVAENPNLPVEVQSQIDLENITFVSNDRLLGIMQGTTATPEQVAEAVRINTESRLRAEDDAADNGGGRAPRDRPGKPVALVQAGRNSGQPAAAQTRGTASSGSGNRGLRRCPRRFLLSPYLAFSRR
jgi:hypothetical protein